MSQFKTYFKRKLRSFSKTIPDSPSFQKETSHGMHSNSAYKLSDQTHKTIGSLFTIKDGNDTGTEKFFTHSFQLQLDLLKTTLDLTSVLVLINLQDEDKLIRHSFSSDFPELLLPGPFPSGIGIAGAMNQGHGAVYIADLSKNYSGLFYYKERVSVGSAAIIHLKTLPKNSADTANKVCVCIDRTNSAHWTEKEKNIITMSSQKIALDLQLGGILNSLDQERNLIQNVCQGFRELNKGLGLETVFNATAKAVSSLVITDFLAISLLDHDSHQTAFVAGTSSLSHLLGLEYDLEEGLIGQVIRLKRPLPVTGHYTGPAPVFSEEGQSLGAMTVAARVDSAFGSAQMAVLQLIATQVAVKIELAKSHETINKLATIDGLTDLANHRTFQHAFDIMLHRAKRRQSPLTLIFCDIDFFKKINDSYGHQFGDLVLKAVSKILADTVRREDMAARYGGEEFALILENSTKKGALQMAERIRHDIADLKFQFENETVCVTISLGIASFPEDAQEKSDIIELADQALYRAKRQGRNQSVTC